MSFYSNQGANLQTPAFLGLHPKRRPSRPKALGFSVGILILLALLAIPALLVFVPGWHVRLAGTQTQGTARLVAECGNSDSSDPATYEVTIEFTDAQGRQQRDESHWACNNFYDDGERVSLWYLPESPGSFLTSGEATWLYVFSALWVVIVIPLALAVVVMMGRLVVRGQAG